MVRRRLRFLGFEGGEIEKRDYGAVGRTFNGRDGHGSFYRAIGYFSGGIAGLFSVNQALLFTT